jgi:hypothetical protein
MFSAPGYFFGYTVGVRSIFHVLRSRTHFRLYRGRQVPFSCYTLTDTFSAVPRASGPVFIFCAPCIVFGGTEGVGYCFHVLCSRNHFRRCLVCRVPFSCFALPDSFSTVSIASGPVFMFCAPGPIFGGTEGVITRFHVLRSRTHFWPYRRRRVPFSCFARPDSFSTGPRVSGPVFMFCAPGIVFGGAECVRSRFHILSSRTRYQRCRGRRVPFSCFELPDSFSAVAWASGPIFMFCAHTLIFVRTEGVRSLFHVLRFRTYFRHYRGCRVRFLVLRAQTHFRRYRGRQVPFICFALPDSLSAVTRASVPFFIICAPELIFGGTEGVGSRFHVLRSRTRFRRYQRASGPFFMFCAHKLIFGGNEGVGSIFHVLRSLTRFLPYRGCRVPFSYFALPDSLSAVPRASGPIFMFCARTRFLQ